VARVVRNLLAAVLLFGAVAHADAADERPGLLDEAEAALEAGDYGRAEALFTRGLETDPSNPELLFGLGAVYQDTDREPMAAAIYARLVAAGHLEVAGRLLVRAPRGPALAARLPKSAAGEAGDGELLPPPAAGEPNVASASPELDLDSKFPVRIHLASYRKFEQALAGWQVLQGENADLLGALEADVKEIDLGPGEGVYFRLRGGPLPSETAAQALCKKLRARGLYCALAYF
jgi:tetratricopeptide (TPR) repeat protein